MTPDTYPRGSRYKKHPRWNLNPHARPRNMRWRCEACSAQFHEATQQTQYDMHCFKQYGGTCRGQQEPHHGWKYAPGSGGSPECFRTVSDFTDDLRKWMAEND